MPTVDADKFLGEKLDYLVIGGGTAGLTVACRWVVYVRPKYAYFSNILLYARLAENLGIKIGVLEAGLSYVENEAIDTPGKHLISDVAPSEANLNNICSSSWESTFRHWGWWSFDFDISSGGMSWKTCSSSNVSKEIKFWTPRSRVLYQRQRFSRLIIGTSRCTWDTYVPAQDENRSTLLRSIGMFDLYY